MRAGVEMRKKGMARLNMIVTREKERKKKRMKGERKDRRRKRMKVLMKEEREKMQKPSMEKDKEKELKNRL